MATLNLTSDELLTTTRAVRKRLDFSRPVERSVIAECLAIAQQAPTASNMQNWHFVVVTDTAKRRELAECYRIGWSSYQNSRPKIDYSPARQAVQNRLRDSSTYLAEHMQDVPVLLLPCIEGRTDGLPLTDQAGRFGTILPATWSFMLAARARGLGTCWTTLHLAQEERAANALGIDYAHVMQVALIPVAYTKGTEFRPAPRESLDSMVHWEQW